MRVTVAKFALAVFLAGCADDVPPPALVRVEPASGKVDEATSIRIVGANFFLGVDGHYDSPAPGVDAAFSAELDGAPLSSVTWSDLAHIWAVVPPGLPLGVHRLTLHTPRGVALSLPAAFEVVADETVTPPGQGGQPVVTQLVTVSAAPLVVTADGSDVSQIVVRAETADGTGVSGQSVSFTAGAGSFDTVEDLGDGRYRAHYRAPTTAGNGRVSLTATLQGDSASVSTTATLRLVASCAGADLTASTWSALVSTVAAANAGTAKDLCVPADSTIPFESNLVLTTDGVVLRGEARVTLSGATSLSPSGLTLAGQSQVVRDLTLTDFTGTALWVAGDDAHLEELDVLHSGKGVLVEPQSGYGQNIVLRRVLFAHDDTGLSVKDAQSVDVAYATFAYQSGAGLAVEESSGVLVRNGLFYQNAQAAITASDGELATAPSYSLFFGNPVTCSSCVLGTHVLSQDPLLVAPDSDDFRLSSKSPAIGAGVDLGLGADLGALPPQ